ncbi:GSCOCG00011393001-RA-CDS, partial [Cotesia congregata]
VLKRKFLEDIFEVLSSKFSDRENPKLILVKTIAAAIEDFNNRNLKANCPLEIMLIKNYPWIAKQMNNALENHASEYNNYHVNFIRKFVEHQDNISVRKSILDKDPIDLRDPKALKVLKNNPERFSQNWELYLKYMYFYYKEKSVHRFVISARWYQDLPIKIAEKCLDDLKNKNDLALIILALLFEGPVLEKLITPFLPTSDVINFKQKEAKENYSLEKTTVRAFNIVKPPVSLDFIAEYCKGDHIHMITHCLFNVARRTSAAGVISFARKLTNRPISVKKHGIRLFFLVSSVQEIREFLINFWRTKTHMTIRTLVFKFARKVFEENPNDETWRLVKECVDSLKSKDKDILKQVPELEAIPNECISEYVKLLIKVYHRIGGEGMDVWSYIKKLLEQVNGHVTTLSAEEIHEEIIDNFVLDVLINVLLNIFNTVLKPQQDPESFLRLTFSSFLQDPISPQELASKVSLILPKLIEIFSITLMSMIASCLSDQLISLIFSCSPQYQLDLVQSLIDFNNNETTIFAAEFLYLMSPRFEIKRFLEIITALQQHPHPAVMAIAHVILHMHS